MTEHTCEVVGCGRPVEDAQVCVTCRRQLDVVLGEVPSLVGELVAAEARRTRRLATVRALGFVDVPLPVNLAAAAAHRRLTEALADAQRVRPGAILSEARAAALAGILRPYSESLRHTETAGQLIGEVLAAAAHAWAVVDLPQHRSTFPVGPCPQVENEQHCDGEVRAYIPRDEATSPSLVCAACGAVWFSWQWVRAGQRIRQREAQLTAAKHRKGSLVPLTGTEGA